MQFDIVVGFGFYCDWFVVEFECQCVGCYLVGVVDFQCEFVCVVYGQLCVCFVGEVGVLCDVDVVFVLVQCGGDEEVDVQGVVVMGVDEFVVVGLVFQV